MKSKNSEEELLKQVADIATKLGKIEARLTAVEKSLGASTSRPMKPAAKSPLDAATLVMAILVLCGISAGVIYILTR